MSIAVFRFKSFSVVQEKSAMKIGTDGVLLGAWVKTENPTRILDIGTGTGLISLMLAQRYPKAQITAIEIDSDSFEEAKYNFEESPFHERISAMHRSLQKYDSPEKFDLIVSNPPFFELTHKQNSSRNTARQQSELKFSDLIFHSEIQLKSDGKLAVIIPYNSEAEFLDLAEMYGLYPNKITHVKGNENAPFKRSLLLLSRIQTQPEISELTLELSRNIYTEEYIALTRDFYLKF